MIDLVKLYIQAGDGGNGKVAFWRNRQVLKGGPDGGDGGDGGEVTIQVEAKLNTLQHLVGVKQVIAGNGEGGGRQKKTGKRGVDQLIKVPAGTVVWLLAENEVGAKRRANGGLEQLMRRDEWPRERYQVEKETQAPPGRARDEIEVAAVRGKFYDLQEESGTITAMAPLVEGKPLKVADMRGDGERLVLAQGGFGGRGNVAFKSARQTTPMAAEYGTWGERRVVLLELRLLANVGLVGAPNVGKSSLLARLTGAQVKVADYPFTTLEPNLGVMRWGERSLVVADIPGLIEGASRGKGLGDRFLRHVRSCRELVVVLGLGEEEIFAAGSPAELGEKLYQQYQQLKAELDAYNRQLREKKMIVVINKSDLYTPEWQTEISQQWEIRGQRVWWASAATGAGLKELQQQILV